MLPQKTAPKSQGRDLAGLFTLVHWVEAGGKTPRTRDEYREWLITFLIFWPYEQDVFKYLKAIRRDRFKGKIGEFLAPAPRRGRPKGRTGDYLGEGLIAVIAYKICGLSRKEILFHLGKIKCLSGRGFGPTSSQYRDLRERMAAGKDMLFNPTPDEIPKFTWLIRTIESMTPTKRREWISDFLRELRPA